MANNEVEQLRASLATPDGYSQTTVTQLERLLDLTPGGKENTPPNVNATKSKARQTSRTAKTLSERSTKKVASNASKTVLASKQQQSVATDVVNKTLKILTEAARAQKDNPESNVTTEKKPTKAATLPGQSSLAAVAACSRAAFACLRRARDADSANAGTQIEQGMVALIGKLILLGLDTHATKELRCLRSSIVSQPNMKTKSHPPEALSLEQMLNVPLRDPNQSRLKLAVSYQSLVMRLLDKSTSASTIDNVLIALHPETEGNPYSTLLSFRDAGSTGEEFGRSLDMYMRHLLSLARSNDVRSRISPESTFRLEIYALYVKAGQKTLTSASAQSDESPSASLLDSVRRYLKRSKQPVLKQLELVSSLGRELLPALTSHNRELALVLASLAEAAGNFNEARQWTQQVSSCEDGPGPTSDLDLMLLDIKAGTGELESNIKKLYMHLASLAEEISTSPSAIEQLPAIRKAMTRLVVSPGRQEDADNRAWASKVILLCLRMWHDAHSSLRNGMRASLSNTDENGSLVESGILACNSCLGQGESLHQSIDLDSVKQAVQQIQSMSQGLEGSKGAKTMLALSNLQWKTYQKLRKVNASKGNADVEMLAASVNSLKDASLSSDDRDRGYYLSKLNALFTANLERFRDLGSSITADICSDLRTTVIEMFRHISRIGLLKNLSREAETIPLTGLLTKASEYDHVRSAVASAIQYAAETRHGSLEMVGKLLDDDELCTVLEAWLLTKKDYERSALRHDLKYCLTRLHGDFVNIGTMRRLVVYRQTLMCAMQIPVSEVSPFAKSVSATEFDLSTEIKRQQDPPSWKHMHLSWQFVRAAFNRSESYKVFEDALKFWVRHVQEVDSGMENTASIDEVGNLVELLMIVYPYLKLRAWPDLQGLTLEVAERLAATTNSPDALQLVAVRALRVRHEASQGDLQLARSIFDNIRKHEQTLHGPLDSQNAMHLGLRKEVAHSLEQAERLGNQLGLTNVKHLVKTQALRYNIMCPNDVAVVAPEDGMPPETPTRPDHIMSTLHVAIGDWRVRFDDTSRALQDYQLAEDCLGSRSSSEDGPKSADRKDLPLKKPAARAKRPSPDVTKKVPRAKPAAKKATAAQGQAKAVVKTSQPSGHEGYSRPKANQLQVQLLASIARQKGLALLQGGDIIAASHALESLHTAASHNADSLLAVACARLSLAQANQIIEADVSFGTLPESTLSLPSCGATQSDVVDETLTDQDDDVDGITQAKQSARVAKLVKSKKPTDLPTTLARARSQLSSIMVSKFASSALNTVYQLTHLATTSAILQSAIEPCGKGGIHPCTLAWNLEISSIEATRRHHTHVATERRKIDLTSGFDMLDLKAENGYVDTAAQFQSRYIDILPAHWTTVSISMNDDGTELWVSRYHAGQTPLVLRLPMTRKAEDHLNETESFTYAAARSELIDIIKCSDYSCHNPPDSSVKGGKSKWWEDREALDRRLHELLKSMEDIWLGGFKGIFSLHARQSELLARFRKSFDAILDRHLPSRQGTKTKKPRPILHSHILDLFIGLDASQEAEDKLDDDVMDLLFFAIDTLHWNGEPNAHDEIDFDAMAIETIDAMRAYHSAASPTPPEQQHHHHLILRLDKRLHLFPWESLPCLHSTPTTRVTSLLQLRHRILHMRRSSPSAERHVIPLASGTSILNPSRDLVRTEATLAPLLAPLTSEQGWTTHVQHKPLEQVFSAALGQSNVLLYFGHGSGAQYIRERTVQRLEKCAEAVWLMGCSSGKVVEGGELESESVPLSYLLAGREGGTKTGPKEKKLQGGEEEGRQGMCMSVVATLWDVTDRDIDKFSVEVGRRWGLWGERREGKGKEKEKEETLAVPKTPARKGGKAPKTPGKTPGKAVLKTPRRNAKKKVVEEVDDGDEGAGGEDKVSLAAAVVKSREVCYLRYLNGAASVVYGIPTYLGD
ncbi:hypothetical protein B9Z65_2979 [Elsinoe australis]|uniref:separase n=1 Tax=Elsinoe australis TaxID=40998 RepID=A0A2P7ZU36_9PEZI|nr:hypothetical protein B9Z65_2979 [Elsinoe australis]